MKKQLFKLSTYGIIISSIVYSGYKILDFGKERSMTEKHPFYNNIGMSKK